MLCVIRNSISNPRWLSNVKHILQNLARCPPHLKPVPIEVDTDAIQTKKNYGVHSAPTLLQRCDTSSKNRMCHLAAFSKPLA
jgi:hypothetical protein